MEQKLLPRHFSRRKRQSGQHRLSSDASLIKGDLPPASYHQHQHDNYYCQRLCSSIRIEANLTPSSSSLGNNDDETSSWWSESTTQTDTDISADCSWLNDNDNDDKDSDRILSVRFKKAAAAAAAAANTQTIRCQTTMRGANRQEQTVNRFYGPSINMMMMIMTTILIMMLSNIDLMPLVDCGQSQKSSTNVVDHDPIVNPNHHVITTASTTFTSGDSWSLRPSSPVGRSMRKRAVIITSTTNSRDRVILHSGELLVADPNHENGHKKEAKKASMSNKIGDSNQMIGLNGRANDGYRSDKRVTFKVNGKEFPLGIPYEPQAKPTLTKGKSTTLESRFGDSLNQADYDDTFESDTSTGSSRTNGATQSSTQPITTTSTTISTTSTTSRDNNNNNNNNNNGHPNSLDNRHHTTGSAYEDDDTSPSSSANLMMSDWSKTKASSIASMKQSGQRQLGTMVNEQQVGANSQEPATRPRKNDQSTPSSSTGSGGGVGGQKPGKTSTSGQQRDWTRQYESTKQLGNNQRSNGQQHPRSPVFAKVRYPLNQSEQQKAQSLSSSPSPSPPPLTTTTTTTAATTSSSATTTTTTTPLTIIGHADERPSTPPRSTTKLVAHNGHWSTQVQHPTSTTLAPRTSSPASTGSYRPSGTANSGNNGAQSGHRDDDDTISDTMRNGLAKSALVQRDLTHKLMTAATDNDDLHLRSLPQFTHSFYPSSVWPMFASASAIQSSYQPAQQQQQKQQTATSSHNASAPMTNHLANGTTATAAVTATPTDQLKQPTMSPNVLARFNSIVRTGPVYPQPSSMSAHHHAQYEPHQYSQHQQQNHMNEGILMAAQMASALSQQLNLGSKTGLNPMFNPMLNAYGDHQRAPPAPFQALMPNSQGSQQAQDQLQNAPLSHAPSRGQLVSMTSPSRPVGPPMLGSADQMLASANQLGVTHSSPMGSALHIKSAPNMGPSGGGANQGESANFASITSSAGQDYQDKLADFMAATRSGGQPVGPQAGSGPTSGIMGNTGQASSGSSMIVEQDQTGTTYSEGSTGGGLPGNSYEHTMNQIGQTGSLASALSGSDSTGRGGHQEVVQTSTSRSSTGGDLYPTTRAEHKSQMKESQMGAFARGDPYDEVQSGAGGSTLNGMDYSSELATVADLADEDAAFSGRPLSLSAYRRPVGMGGPSSAASLMTDSFLNLAATERLESPPRRYYARRPMSYSDYAFATTADYLTPATSSLANVAAFPRTYPRSSSATWLSTSGAPSAYTEPSASPDPWLEQATNGYEISPLASMLAASHHGHYGYGSAAATPTGTYRYRHRYHRLSPYAAAQYLSAASSAPDTAHHHHHGHQVHPAYNFVSSYPTATVPMATEAIGYAISPLAAAAATAASTLAALDKSRNHHHHGWFTFPRFALPASTSASGSGSSAGGASASTSAHSVTATGVTHASPIAATHAIPSAAFYHRPTSYALSSVPFYALARPHTSAAATQYAAASTTTPTIIPYFHPGAFYAYRPAVASPLLTAASYAYPIRIPVAATIPRPGSHLQFAPAATAIRAIGVRPIFSDLQFAESKAKVNLSTSEPQQNNGKSGAQSTLSAMAKNLTRKMFGSASQLKPVHIAANAPMSPQPEQSSHDEGVVSAPSFTATNKMQPKSSTIPFLPFSTLASQFSAGPPESASSSLNQRYANLFSGKHFTSGSIQPTLLTKSLVDQSNNNINSNHNLVPTASSLKRVPAMTQQQIEALGLQAALLQRRSSDHQPIGIKAASKKPTETIQPRPNSTNLAGPKETTTTTSKLVGRNQQPLQR